MRWNFAIIFESILIGVISWRKPALRWWEALIGIDLIASVFQLIPYRSGLRMHSRLIWEAGIVCSGPVLAMAVSEASTASNRGMRYYYHVRLLAVWIAFRLTCISLQTQPDLVIYINHVLLAGDALCFALWSAIFLLI